MAMDDAQMLALLAPEFRAYVERSRMDGGPSISELSVEEARQFMRDIQQADVSHFPVSATRYALEDFSVVLLKPMAAEKPMPVALYLHGGGWVLGDPDTHARIAREIAVHAQTAVVFVDYARAPEALFPIALEQCYRALQWVAEQGTLLGLDASRVALAGDSAGGNLAAGVSMLAARRGGPAIQYQALLYPVTDCNFETRSYLDFERGLNLDRDSMRWFWEKYAPDAAARANPLASPLQAAEDDLKAMPPTLILTAECDVLRDEAEEFARKLMRAGVRVVAARYAGTLHGFMVADELASASQTCSAMRLLFAELRCALHGDK